VAEIWKDITGFPYEVSNLGRVRRTLPAMGTWAGKILSPRCGDDGYLSVVLCSGNKQLSRKVHNLVAEAFIGPRPKNKEVNHKDADKHNNRVGNLEYLTPSANVQHAADFGLMSRPGEKHGMARLTEQQVKAIRKEYIPRVMPYRKLAAKYGVALSTVAGACGRSSFRTWSHLR
jgi:hypothetical protein